MKAASIRRCSPTSPDDGVEVVTFGCRFNAFESEVIRHEAEGAGLTETVVINSCAVTNEAVAQARQSIRRLKRERPHARIVVTGCAAQTQSRMFAEMAEVDRVIGNDDKMRRRCLARRAYGARCRRSASKPARRSRSPTSWRCKRDGATSARRLSKGLPRAFVQVQNGCDHRCTFCIIPYGRGNSRSVPMGAVVDQVRALVERGHAEIVLTGVDLTSYGADLPGAPKLGQLTKANPAACAGTEAPAHFVDRFQVEADRDLLDVIAEDTRLMPHLHLSLQSGDDLILKRMKRRHSRRADAIEFCAQVRRLRPDIALRRRYHRGLSDRDGGDVCALAGSGRGMRPHLPARVSILETSGHAGGAHAAGRGRSDQGACEAVARERGGGLATAAGVGDWATRQRIDRERRGRAAPNTSCLSPSAGERQARCGH